MKRVLALLGTVAVVSAIAIPAAQAAPSQRPIAAFSIAAPNGTTPSGLVARAVVPAGVSCPVLHMIDTKGHHVNTKMAVRANPANTGAAFASLTACTAPLPAHLTSAKVGTMSIPAAMPTQVKKMAIFGDTGCRIKGTVIQNCASPDAWPLARISAHITAEHPDLIMFTGDYFYREGECPADQLALCGATPTPVPGMPFKDTSESWTADVFTPMADVLAAAPIVLTRGNHEACNRGGNGYFTYFDPRVNTAGKCAPTLVDGVLSVPNNELTAPYAVDIQVSKDRKLRIVNMDSAYGWDCEVSSMLPTYQAQFTEAEALASAKKENWLLIHRPVFGWQPSDDCGPTGGWVVADEATASQGKLAKYNMLLSSHIHLAESVNIPGAPGQLVIGNGGTKLEPSPTVTFPATGPSFTGGGSFQPSTSSWADVRHGYAIATPGRANEWAIAMKDKKGAVFAACHLLSGKITCINR